MVDTSESLAQENLRQWNRINALETIIAENAAQSRVTTAILSRLEKKVHSMWAVYLGIITLIVPELLYYTLGYQVLSPFILGYLGIFLLVYGGLGRLWDQGIDHPKEPLEVKPAVSKVYPK